MNHGHVYREWITPAATGQRVVDHLLERWRHGSAAEWTARLAAGAELCWHRPPWEEPRVPLSFALLHRDDHLLAVAKPAGLPTLPSGGRFLEHTLLTLVQRRWPEATPLHRLDRGTSGIVLFARTALARRGGSESFQRGVPRRLYRGLIEGTPRDDSFTLDAPIGDLPHPRIGRVFGITADGKASVTRVQVIERRATTTLVAIAIETGRPHQIRIHLAHAGHPLVGEPFFGRAPSAANPGDAGYLLHAERITLPHPANSPAMRWKDVDVECLPPSELRPR